MSLPSLAPVIEKIYASVFVDEAEFRTLFGEIANAVGVMACGIKTEWATGSMDQTWYGLPEGFERAFVAEYWREDPWTHGSRHASPGTFQLSNELVPERELVQSRFHAELCVPFGLHDAMGTCLIRDGDRYVTFGMMRPSAPRGDGTREAALGVHLVPHLTRVMRLRHEAARLHTRTLAARVGIDGLPFAALVVDGLGRIEMTNSAADALLRTGDGLTSSRSGIGALTPGDTRLLRHAIASTADPLVQRGREVLSLRRRNSMPLAVILTPLPGPKGERLAILHVLDPTASAEPTERLLRSMFGLSPAETRVALSIARGNTPDEAATQLGRGVTTIRSQLRAVFRKTHTTRQAELTRLLASLGACGG